MSIHIAPLNTPVLEISKAMLEIYKKIEKLSTFFLHVEIVGVPGFYIIDATEEACRLLNTQTLAVVSFTVIPLCYMNPENMIFADDKGTPLWDRIKPLGYVMNKISKISPRAQGKLQYDTISMRC